MLTGQKAESKPKQQLETMSGREASVVRHFAESICYQILHVVDDQNADRAIFLLEFKAKLFFHSLDQVWSRIITWDTTDPFPP